jgi:hypothetical protein
VLAEVVEETNPAVLEQEQEEQEEAWARARAAWEAV